MNNVCCMYALPCFLCLVILYSISTPAYTQDNDDLLALSLKELLSIKVTVAAQKNESWLSSSGTVYVIHRNDIENYGWRDLKEILASVPNMDYFYQWSWLPGGQRGFTGNMSGTLLLIDGREVQNLLANEAFIMNNFPSARIERVEILQGPNSTLYGGNAAQGVINVITRLGKGVNEVSVLLGEVATRHAHLLVNHSFNKGTFAVSSSYFTSDLNYAPLKHFLIDDEAFSRNSKDPLRNHNANDFRNSEENYTFDAAFTYNDYYAGTNLTRTVNVSGIEAVAYDYLTGDDSRRGYSLYYFGKQFDLNNAFTGNAEVSYFREYKEKDRLTAIIAEDAQVYDDLILYTEREDIGPSKRLRFKTQWQYIGEDDQDWIFGYDGWHTEIGRKIKYRQTANGIVFETPESWPIDKEKSDKHAVYGQYSKLWFINPQTIKLSAGLRYHRQDFTDSSWLPRISLVYQPDSAQALKFTYGEAFRPPTIFEFDLVEDDKIESQTMQMFELNWSKAFTWRNIQFANISAIYRMKAKNFYQKIQDAISGKWQTEVTGQHSVKGWEHLTSWKSQQFEGQFSFRIARPDKMQVNSKKVILNIPEYKFKLGLSYHFDQNWSSGVFVDHWSDTKTEANRFNQPRTELVTIPSWTTLSCNIGYQYQAVKINFYIENLLNKTYYHANARATSPVKFIQAPRNVRLSFSYQF